MSTDRGLCGSLNINVFKQVLTAAREWQAKGVGSAPQPDRQQGAAVLPPRSSCRSSRPSRNIGDKPHIKDLIGGVDAMLELYRDGKIDRLFVAGNKFINTMTQQADGAADAAGRDDGRRAICRSAGTTSTSRRRTSSSPAS